MLSGTNLVRDTNDRAALDLILSIGPVTKTRLGELTGVSKVTAGHMLSRLQRRGLVQVVGEDDGRRRGPNAALYGVVPSVGYVVGLHIGPDVFTAAVADITGVELVRVSLDPTGASDPVSAVRDTVTRVTRDAGVPMSRLHCLSIGTPGVVDPRTGDLRYSFDLTEWHTGVLAELRRYIRRPVLIENDVNLAGLAERSVGAARGVDNFVVVWIDRGIGMAVVMDGRLHRGALGSAGEIGYLPVPGAPPPTGTANPRRSAFQSQVGAEGVTRLARGHRLRGSAADCVAKAAAGHPRGEEFLDQLATRLAYGLSSVCVVLDPELCVLSGAVGHAGGVELAGRVQRAIAAMCPSQPRVVASELADDSVLSGALEIGLGAAREDVFARDLHQAG